MTISTQKEFFEISLIVFIRGFLQSKISGISVEASVFASV